MNMTIELYKIVSFIRQKVGEGVFRGGFVGLSGGIDSTVCAALMVKALGNNYVLGVAMPARDSDPQDEIDARRVADWLDIQFDVKPITPILDYFEAYEFAEQFDYEEDILPYQLGDFFRMTYQKEHLYILKLRSRMLVGTSYAHKHNYFQCQTINRTEKELGWGDLFGDMAGDIAPIEHLWKTDVYKLADLLNVPKYVIERASGSGNFPLSNLESLIGTTFEEVEMVLQELFNQRQPEEIVEITKIPIEKVLRVWKEWYYAQYKMEYPHKLSNKH